MSPFSGAELFFFGLPKGPSIKEGKSSLPFSPPTLSRVPEPEAESQLLSSRSSPQKNSLGIRLQIALSIRVHTLAKKSAIGTTR